MKRQHQWLLVGSTLVLSWLAMQVVHELGHILAAWATGGRIAEVRLHPLQISFTLLSTNPSPLIVAWMGPVFGVLVPLIAWSSARRIRLRGDYVFRFFAGFCCVTNGTYLVAGSIYKVGDAWELMRFGAPQWLLFAFGFVFIPLGLYFWNGLGHYFGLGRQADKVDAMVAIVVTIGVAFVICLELLFALSITRQN